MKTSMLALALTLISTPGCLRWGTARAGERLEYQERVTFTCETPTDYRAVQVSNLGPGAIEVEVELHDGARFSETLLFGAEANYVLTWVKRVTVVHADPAAARLEWSASEDMRDEIEVRVD